MPSGLYDTISTYLECECLIEDRIESFYDELWFHISSSCLGGGRL